MSIGQQKLVTDIAFNYNVYLEQSSITAVVDTQPNIGGGGGLQLSRQH